jgi:hypothetical protein
MDALFHPDGLFARLRSVRRAEWESYVVHAFVRGIGSGTLPVESFRHYLLQDYLFLVHYARAWALVCAKAGTLDDMRFAQGCVHAILDVERIAEHEIALPSRVAVLVDSSASMSLADGKPARSIDPRQPIENWRADTALFLLSRKIDPGVVAAAKSDLFG